VNDRREKLRIASAFQDFYLSHDVFVTRVRLDYLPHHAMVEAKGLNKFCAVVAEDFGNHLGHEDFQIAPCDF
jgi:hypothetical protein